MRENTAKEESTTGDSPPFQRLPVYQTEFYAHLLQDAAPMENMDVTVLNQPVQQKSASCRTTDADGQVVVESTEEYMAVPVRIHPSKGDYFDTHLLVHPTKGVPPVGSRWGMSVVDESCLGESYVGVLVSLRSVKGKV